LEKFGVKIGVKDPNPTKKFVNPNWKKMNSDPQHCFSCRILDLGSKNFWIRIQDKKMVGSGSGIKYPCTRYPQHWSMSFSHRMYRTGTGW
jgi:hypothetical protein